MSALAGAPPAVGDGEQSPRGGRRWQLPGPAVTAPGWYRSPGHLALLALAVGGGAQAGPLAAAIAAVAWVAQAIPERGPRARAVIRLRKPAAALLGLAGILGLVGAPAMVPVLACLTALGLRPLARVAPADRLLERIESIMSTVARALAAVLTVPALMIVLLRWATDRLVGYDPRGPARERGRWTPRPRDGDPRLLVGPTAPARFGRRWHRRLAGLAFALPFVLVAVAVVRRPAPVPVPPAVAHQPGWAETYRESADITQRLVPDPVTFFALPSYRGRAVNQTGPIRRSWQPPACSCPRLTVWWYGGSAAWGLYQRDDESLPSQLAREAWKHGIALDIENRAMPGWVIGQEVRAFAEALTTDPAPDLVIFYDGNNDVDQQINRNGSGYGSDLGSGPDVRRALGPMLAARDRFLDLQHPRHGGDVVHDDPTGPMLTPDEIASVVAKRYRADARAATALAADRGAAAVFAWQPTLGGAPEGTGEADVVAGSPWKEVLAATPRLLGDEVIDLSDSLRSTGGPVFVDQTHTSERGAAIVARALWRDIAQQVRLAAHQP